jgi:hypothetical protein
LPSSCQPLIPYLQTYNGNKDYNSLITPFLEML